MAFAFYGWVRLETSDKQAAERQLRACLRNDPTIAFVRIQSEADFFLGREQPKPSRHRPADDDGA